MIGTVLHNHVVLQSLTTIGDDNEVFPFAVLGADPQDLKYAGERATCVIGDRNQIREHVTIHRGTANGGGITRIGDDNLLMVASHVAHDCIVGNEIVLANQVMLAGHVRIRGRREHRRRRRPAPLRRRSASAPSSAAWPASRRTCRRS